MPQRNIHILPVYSEEHPDSQYHYGTTRLLKHQVATWKAINDPDIDVIFNTAMTGDGKSLAAYLPAFLEEHQHIIAMYPTNELILDQHASLAKYQELLSLSMPSNATMYGAEITRLMRIHDTTVRLEEVRKLVERHALLLTNPDLLHLIMSHQYGWGHLRKELPVLTGQYFDYFLFDEFHVFEVPQVIAVMNILGYLSVNYRDKSNERKKFVFLSATPGKLMNGLLERGGLRYQTIGGSYVSEERPGYHCILQPCDIHLHEVSQETPTEAWVISHLEEIHAFFQKHPRSKAAILVYSVATARRLFTLLQEYFEPRGITVGENTGLTNPKERELSRQKHILVGTTTVDIGVDFHINYLIFEAYNAGSFLQRFGRLGRHTGYPAYEAHALLPRFVLERLADRFGEDEQVERAAFNETVREVFPTEQDFKDYTKRWGVVQAAQVLVDLQNEGKRDENHAFVEALTAQYELFYTLEGKPVMGAAIKKYWRYHKHTPTILKELQSFRGQSPLSCAIWDTDNELKTYDLFFLLANTEFTILTSDDFLREVKLRKLEERDFKDRLLYLKIDEYVSERLQLVLHFKQNLIEHAEDVHKVMASTGFSVQNPRPTWLDKVNRHLQALKLVYIVSDFSRQELKRRLGLSTLFPIYRLHDSTGNEYSVTFGQEALLLDSVLYFRKVKDEKPMML
jgi:CRISPR-associated endonuclease/helicase Cas3